MGEERRRFERVNMPQASNVEVRTDDNHLLGPVRMLGRGGTDIAVRLSAFILFCLGVQILWTGASDLLATLNTPR